jgi:hypothetical protein
MSRMTRSIDETNLGELPSQTQNIHFMDVFNINIKQKW